MMRLLAMVAVCGLCGCLQGTSHLVIRSDGSGTFDRQITLRGRFGKIPLPEVQGVKATLSIEPTDDGGETRHTRLAFASLTALERYYAAQKYPTLPPFTLKRVAGNRYRIHWEKAGSPLLTKTARRRLELGERWRFGRNRWRHQDNEEEIETNFELMAESMKSIKSETRLQPPGKIIDTNGNTEPDGSVKWVFDGAERADKARQIWKDLSAKERQRSHQTASQDLPLGDHPVFANFQVERFAAEFEWNDGPNVIGEQWPPEEHVQPVVTLEAPPLPTLRRVPGDDHLRIFRRQTVLERASPFAEPYLTAEWKVRPTAAMGIGSRVISLSMSPSVQEPKDASLSWTWFEGNFDLSIRLNFGEKVPDTVPVIAGSVDLIYAVPRQEYAWLTPPGFGSYALTWVDTQPQLVPLRKGGNSVIIYCHADSVNRVVGSTSLTTVFGFDDNGFGESGPLNTTGDAWMIVHDANGFEPGTVEFSRGTLERPSALVWRRARNSTKTPRLPLHTNLWRAELPFRFEKLSTR